MGYFDEQIKERKNKNNEAFSDSMKSIVGAVNGRDYAISKSADELTLDAIDDILSFYSIKKKELTGVKDDLDGQLEHYMRPYGIMRRKVELKKGWFNDCIGPILALRKDNGHAVALIPHNSKSYMFFDENEGRKVKITSSNEDIFEQTAYTFYRPFPLRELTAKDIFRFVISCVNGADFAMVAVMALVVAVIGMITPALTKVLIGTVADRKDVGLLMMIAVALVCTSVGALLFDIINVFCTERIAVKIKSSACSATMMRILSLPASFFKNYSSGELATYEMQMEMLCTDLPTTVITTVMTSIFSLVYVLQMIRYAKALTLPALIMMGATFAVTVLSTLAQIRIMKQQLKLTSKENGISYEMISGVQKIKLAGAEKRAFAKWAEKYSKSAMLQYNPPLFIKASGAVILAITSIGTIVLYYEAIKNGVSVADYFAFNTAFALMSGAFTGLAGITASFAQINSTLDLIKPILEAKPEVSEGRKVISRLSGGIDISNVSFRYEENEPDVIHDLSLKIKPGQYVAIVGKTGCGKSTLVRLLLGFEKPTKGAIYYDGSDIETIDLKSLRKCMGVVIQNGKLFADDIYNNIIITDPTLSLDDAWEAARMAGLAEDIEKMPMGMSTFLSESGGGISGGQRQRIMIARAIAPKPKILIFDEATSALDNITQKQVSDSLDNLKCTRIVIAHRLSTIRNADRILVLDGGGIIEDGSYDELIEKNGYFAKLVERQRIDA